MSQDAIAGIIVFALIPLLGAAVICGLAYFLRRRFSDLTLPLALVISHSALLLLCVALYPTGIFTADIPFDDLYFAYFLFPGTHIDFAVGKFIIEPLTPVAFRLMSPRLASLVGIVFLPGLLGLFLGGLQWYFIGRGVNWLRSRRLRLA
jgi:hypothetical protein